MLSGDAKKSIDAFDSALELQPTLLEAKFNRAVARLKVGDAARASKELEQVFANETSPLRGRAAYHNALALDRLGRSRDAETWLERAVQLDPAFDSALLYLGKLRERRGDAQGAGRAYLEFLKKHPQSVIAMLRFGVAAHRAGETTVAQRYLRMVVDQAPLSNEATEARKYLVMWE